MTRLRDHVRWSTPKELSRRLLQLASKCQSEAERLWVTPGLEEGYCRVLPNVLKCTARQLKILNASAALPIEVAAGACRTTFELNVRVRMVLKDAHAMKDFIAEVLYDERKLIESFRKLADESTPKALLDQLANEEKRLAGLEQGRKLVKPPRANWSERATVAECKNEYEALYGLYSNYTHATAWLVNTTEDFHDGGGYRGIFAAQTQLYASDTFQRIQDALRDRGVAAPS